MSHGGKRKGAGRKPLPIPKKKLTVELPPHELQKFRDICKARDISQAKQVSQWIKRTRIKDDKPKK